MQPADLCTFADVQAYMPLGTALSEPVVERLITAASVAIMRVAEREFATDAATVEEGVSDGPDEVERTPTSRRFSIDPWRSSRIIPVGDMAAAPTRIDLLDRDFDALTEDIADGLYTPEPFNRSASEPITALRFARNSLTDGAAWIEVTAEWGWPQVPDDIRQACIAQVREWYVRDVQRFTPEFADEGLAAPARELGLAARDAARAYRYLMVV